MPPSRLSRSVEPLSGRYLSFAGREEIALLRAQGLGVREVARRLGRAASTISRELRRNAATRGGELEYRATTAQWHAERSARRPKRAKLVTNPALRAYVQDRLSGAVATLGGAAMGTGVEPAADCRSACGSTFRVTKPCASATKPSTRRFTSRAGAR